MPNFSGFVYDDAGAAINGATVHLYDRNTTTPSRANTTTNSSGFWNIDHSTEGQFDVAITSGSSVRRVKYDNEQQFERLEVSEMLIRGTDNAFSLTQQHASTANYLHQLAPSEGLGMLDGSTMASTDGGLGTDIRIFKNADESISSTVLQNDDDFLWYSAASVTWHFRLMIRGDDGSNSDFVYDWSLPSGATYSMWPVGDLLPRVANDGPAPISTGWSQTGNDGNERMHVFEGFIVMSTTAGIIQLQWAANLSAGTSNIRAESGLIATKMRVN
jgi:hypothetical protein